MDNKTKEQRSKNMAAVKARDTKPELLIRKALFRQGFRYRLNVRKLPGSPDIVLAKYKTVIFVNGCFWHGHHKCKKAVLPETNTDFWREKIGKTKIRDKKKKKMLKKLGWHCIICWECDILHNRYSFVVNDGHLNLIILKVGER
jgi:DNA mismatch endonuclease (patch repair protein)